MAFNAFNYQPRNQFMVPQAQLPAQPAYVGPQSYVNIQAPNNSYNQNGSFTRFVSSEAEALSMPNPAVGCSFYVDGENMILYAKYADGRPMEAYDLVLRENTANKEGNYVTASELDEMLDKKLEEFGKKFVVKRDRGTTNG